MFPENFIQIISYPLFKPLVDAFTLLIALFTALAALRSSRAASEANEIKLLPILNIYFRDSRGSDYKFLIKNLGEGPAFDIQISPWIVLIKDFKQIWELKLSLEKTNLIEPKEEVTISYHSLINGKDVNVSDIMAAHLHPETSSTLPRIKFNIIFINALRHKYFTIIELGKGGTKIIIPPSKLHLRTRLTFILSDLYNLLRRFSYLSLWKFKKLKIN